MRGIVFCYPSKNNDKYVIKKMKNKFRTQDRSISNTIDFEIELIKKK